MAGCQDRDTTTPKIDKESLVGLDYTRGGDSSEGQITVGRENVTFPGKSVDSTAGKVYGMVPRSTADHDGTGPSSTSLVVFVPTAVLVRIHKRSYDISISMQSHLSAATLLEEAKTVNVQITVG